MTDIAALARDTVDAALTCRGCGHRQTTDIERGDPDVDAYYAADLRYDCQDCGRRNEAAVRITVDDGPEVTRRA